MKALLPLLLICNLSMAQPNQSPEDVLKKINKDYVQYWLDGNEEGVLSLFEEEAQLSPSGLAPVKGLKAIASFWFPKDSSVTTIHAFNNEVVNLKVENDIAYSTQRTFLSWSYEKGSTVLKRDQWGIALTVYRKQSDNSWKISRQMWTDTKSVDRN